MYTALISKMLESGSSNGTAVPTSTGAKSGAPIGVDTDTSTGLSSGTINFGGKDQTTIWLAIGALVVVVGLFTKQKRG